MGVSYGGSQVMRRTEEEGKLWRVTGQGGGWRRVSRPLYGGSQVREEDWKRRITGLQEARSRGGNR